MFLALLALLVCSFAPGFFFVRRLRWGGLEKLCGSVALSLILLWLGSWTIYAFAPPAAYYGLAAACLLAAGVGARDAQRLFRMPRVRHAALAYGILLAWTLLVLAVIRNYSGALWSGDWLEHFQRTLFFLHRFPTNTPVYGDYLLPARPPMMNVLAAFFLAITQDRFEIFQLVFTFLNLLAFLPCCLALPLLARTHKISLLPLMAIFAMNPAVMQNSTYTWTKLLTAFYVILALCLYLTAWRKRDFLRMPAAFLCLAAGLLVHYSAGPYVVFFALHYLLVVFRARPGKVKELAAIGVTSAVLLFTWFGWSMATYGTKPTFASNTSVTATKQIQGSNFAKIAGNVFDSIIPRIAYDPYQVHAFDQPYAPAVVRDNIFLLYNTNLVLSMGVIGGPLIVWFAIAAFRRPRPPSSDGHERTFWLLLIAFSLIIGLAVVGERDYFGVAHLTLIPLELLGLTLLSAQFLKSRTIAILVIAGCAIDFGAGVLLHARVQHLDNTTEHTYFTGLSVRQGQFSIGQPGPESLNQAAWRNWMAKHLLSLCSTWLTQGEGFRPGDPALEPARMNLRAALAERVKEDDTLWHGWYRRNGGHFEMIGDHFPGDITTILLILAALALMVRMARQLPSAALATTRAPTPRSSPRPPRR